MTAASFWSLLLPALEIAEQLNNHDNKFYSLMPVVIGFLFGAFFVHFADVLLPENVFETYSLIEIYYFLFHLSIIKSFSFWKVELKRLKI
jgi:zinc transporter ZupT